MDRLHLKCALMDLLEHDLIILESKEDVAAVVEAARKLGYEVSADPRISREGSSWVVTARHSREASDEDRPGRQTEESEVSVKV